MKHTLQLRGQWAGRKLIFLLLFAQVWVVAGLTGAQAQTIRYVKEGGSGEGLVWEDASGSLQAMIDQSSSGDQIWVAKGTYKPGDQRWHSFNITKTGVAIYGGFNGDETSLADRVLTYPSSTTLSGEIGNSGDPSDNSYHVVGIAFSDRSTILDGFVISDGHADGEYDDAIGSGIYSVEACGVRSSPIIRNCYFANNSSTGGGAFYAQGAGQPLLINCVFFNNTATDESVGGGAVTISNSEVTMINCTLVGNRSTYGNAIRNEGTLTLTNSILWNNRPLYDGDIQGNDGLDIVGRGRSTLRTPSIRTSFPAWPIKTPARLLWTKQTEICN
ncbi:right-handed parallel beta-helix repeat-containing protein [Larkinella terrae]|uniref:Right handed beta helix domain-containing protein n=1 Tax=Larkinella terrae TaxID=2025311 RepID=A0A7K0EW21_9BACT|nr:right-handed parallel beta-helix repeat-containing protein [Larkinella terrae]MRS65942.1 hypothetical protein [Larkinella terrae]